MEHFLCENFSDKWVTYRCGGAMGWCTAVVWCDAVVRCGGVVRYGDAVARRCGGAMVRKWSKNHDQ